MTVRKTPISEALQAEIAMMRDTAKRLRDEMTSRTLKETLTSAIADIDSFERMFDSEEYIRMALAIPGARITFVADVKAKYGATAMVVPGDRDKPN